MEENTIDRIKLANGSEYGCASFALASVGYLFIRVNMSLVDAARIFGNPENISRIEYYPSADGEPFAISGFTALDYIVNEGDCVRVALKQPVLFDEVQSNGND